MDLKHIERLASVQEDVARKTENDIKLLEKYADEYRALKEQLSTLPDRVSYDIMVPFGNVAFMPGKLVHTNEIRVLLGDDWFVDRSAKQAVEIVERRLKIVDQDVAGLKRQRDLFKPHLDFTKEFREQAQQEAQIVEEYNEYDEKAWRAQHRLNVKKHFEEQRAARDAEKLKDDEEEYWRRMEEAEAEGRENEEADIESSPSTLASFKSETDPDHLHPHETLPSETKTPSNNDIETKPTPDNDRLQRPSKHESTKTSMKKNAGKSVRWQDIEQNESMEDEAQTSSDDSEEYVELCRPKTINFVHTPSTNVVAQPGQRSTVTEGSTTDSDVRPILSPADIGSSHEFPTNAPKSILKKRTNTEQKSQQPEKSEKSQQSEKSEKSQKSEKSSSPIRRKASSQIVQKSISHGRPLSNVIPNPIRQPLHPSTTLPALKVVERNTSSSDPSKTNSDSTISSTADASSNDDAGKRISKFKASRLKKSTNTK